MKKIILDVKECYCGLSTFYENVAKKMGVAVTDSTQFDCRKIYVSRPVQEEICVYYRDEKCKANCEISAMLLCYGPKANVDSVQYVAVVEEGFLCTES